MNDLIRRSKLIEHLNACLAESVGKTPITDAVLVAIKCAVEEMPGADAVPVVRCKDCAYYHKRHVEKDGKEYSYDDMPKEAFDGPSGMFVTLDYGINVSGKCERDVNAGYEVDKIVYREENDFCSKAERRADA